MQYDNEKKDKLNRLEKSLYSRNNPEIINSDRSNLQNKEISVKENWQDFKQNNFDELAAKISKMADRKHNLVKKIFFVSLFFFLAAVGFAAFVFLGGMNLVSSKNVEIEVVGPIAVAGGQEVSLDINVVNKNNVDLEGTSLIIEYEEGIRSMADLSKDLKRERFDLGKITTNESFRQNLKLVFFGEKGAIKKMKISLEYRVENSSALFYKEKNHEISISSAPVIVTSTYPKEVNANQEIVFDLEIVSNSKDKINNFLVNVDYPFGFIFKDSLPKTSANDNSWFFDNLNPGDKKTIKIIGTITGQDNEEKVFKINTGTASENDDRLIAIPMSGLTESILIKKPFIGLDIFIQGKEGNFVGSGGSEINTEFVVRNNLQSQIFNTAVSVSLKGGAFNQDNLRVGSGGFFQSIDDTIFWDKRTMPELSDLAPGEERKLSFRLSPFLYSEIAAGAKPEIELTFNVKGERILESGSAETVTVVEKRKIVLGTNIDIVAKNVRTTGNIENFSPIPPKADVRTTYTVMWSITNSFNQVSNVEVRAKLPSYVKWTGIKYPQNEIFSFNEVTGELVWNVGSILANTGFGSNKKEIYFQLEFLPSRSQIGQAPVLLQAANLYGIDKNTGLKVESASAEITTSFFGDPIFKQGDEKVSE